MVKQTSTDLASYAATLMVEAETTTTTSINTWRDLSRDAERARQTLCSRVRSDGAAANPEGLPGWVNTVAADVSMRMFLDAYAKARKAGKRR